MLVRDKVSDSKNNEDDWKEKQNTKQPGGNIAQWLEYLLPSPAAPGLIPMFLKFWQIVNVSEVNQRCLGK